MAPDEKDKTTPILGLVSPHEDLELRRHYLQNLVHELSSPLTPLVGYLKLFRDGALGSLTDLQKKCLDRMASSATRLRRILEDLSTVVEMESGVYQAEKTVIDLADMIRGAIDRASERARDAKIELLLELPGGKATVEGDESRFTLMFDHLLQNGIKFNSAGGMVLARLLRRQSGFRLEVFDSGVGIPEAELARVFEPFYQVDHAETRKFGGAGLGLTLVKWIAEKHGGRILLESPPSVQPPGHFFRGTLAIVELPAKP